MKAHKQDMYAAWARDHGISGYDQWDPKNQEKARQKAAKFRQKKIEREKFNETVTQR